MSKLQVVLILALTLVAALHRFSVSYGYRGWSWERSWDDAYYAGVRTAVASILFVVLSNLWSHP